MGHQDAVPDDVPQSLAVSPEPCSPRAPVLWDAARHRLSNLLPLQSKQPPEQRQQQKGTLTLSPQLLGARMQPANMIKKMLSRGHYHRDSLPLPVQAYLS